MISLDLTKSSEVRKAGDWSNSSEKIRKGDDQAFWYNSIVHSITLFDIANPFARNSNLKASVYKIMYQQIVFFFNSNKKYLVKWEFVHRHTKPRNVLFDQDSTYSKDSIAFFMV